MQNIKTTFCFKRLTTRPAYLFFIEAMSLPVTPENEERNEIKEDDSHLKELHSYVTGCEENLAKHK